MLSGWYPMRDLRPTELRLLVHSSSLIHQRVQIFRCFYGSTAHNPINPKGKRPGITVTPGKPPFRVRGSWRAYLPSEALNFLETKLEV